MRKRFTRFLAAVALLLFIAPPLVGWGQTTYEQLTSIANIDESAQYVLGIDGTGFHYEGTSSWGKTALPSAQTPIYYTLTKASDGNSFTAQAIISGTTYYLQIPTSNTFGMATSTGTNTDIIIGTTQVSGTNYAVANKSTTARHLRINGTSGLRSYAGTTGNMAFFYKVNGALTPSDLTLTGAPVSLSFDLYNNFDAQTISYTTSSTGTVTVSASEYITATVDNGTITITPNKATPSAQTITVNQAADETYAAGSVTFTVTIADSTPYDWVLTDLASLTTSDVFVIVGTTGLSNYSMTNGNGTGSAPSAVEVTVENGAITSTVHANIQWNISGNATDGYTFYPNGTTETWLYCTNTNNGVRVGTNANKTFKLSDGYLKHDGTSRYVGIYNSQDWRCYDNTTGNIAGQTFAFYKRTVPAAVATPTFSVATGTYNANQSVMITCATGGATIYYTTDGSEPTNLSPEYTEAINITQTTTLKAIAIKDDDESNVASATYTMKCATPTFSIDEGTYYEAQSVALSSTDGATIHYTTNGSDPTASSSTYSDAIPVFSTQTIKAIAVKDGWSNSEIGSATFTITIPVTIAVAREENTGTVTTRGVVTYKNGTTVYMQDGTGAIVVYGSNTPSVGDDIVVFGTRSLFNGLLEITNPQIKATMNTGVVVDPVVKTIAEINDNDENGNKSWQAMLVTIERAEYSSSSNIVSQGSNEIAVYGSMGEASDGDIVTFTGNIGNHEGVQMVNMKDITIHHDPVITVVDGTAAYIASDDNSILYEISNNYVSGIMTAVSSESWLTIEACDQPDAVTHDGAVTFRVTENTGAPREATITLTYTYNTNQTVVVTVNVRQAGIPSVSVNNTNITVAHSGDVPELTISYESLVIENTSNFSVEYFDSDGIASAEKPNWFGDVEFSGNNASGYVLNVEVNANDGDERYAYFKVHAIDKNDVSRYTSLITVTQAAPQSYTAIVGTHTNGSLLINNSSPTVSIKEGTEVTVTAVANDGYRLTDLYYYPTDGSGNTSIDITTKKFTMPSENITVAAVYSEYYEITSAVQPASVADITATESACAGDNVDVIITDIATGYYYISMIVTKTSDGSATDISVSGNVGDGFTFTMPDYPVTVTAICAKQSTWNLATASYEVVEDPDQVTWTSTYATMTNKTGTGSTSASNYLGGANNRTSTRFYANNILTITPASSYEIKNVVFTATTDGYASVFANSNWENDAVALNNGTTVVVTPTNGKESFTAIIGGTCGFTSVVVNYNVYVPVNASNEITDNVTIPSGVIVEVTSTIKVPSGKILTVNGTIVNDNPANLIIEDGGQLISNNSVQATVKKSIAGHTRGTTGWNFIATTAVDGTTPTTANGILDDTPANYDLFYYDEPYHYWRNYKDNEGHTNNDAGFVSDGGKLLNGKGYLYANANNAELSFEGATVAANKKIDLTLSYSDANLSFRGFNLVGNPFTYQLTSSSEITLNGTDFNTYYMIENGEEIKSTTISETPINPGTGFIVQADAENQHLVFNPEGVSKGERASKPSFIRIDAGNDGFMDRAYIQFGNVNTLRKFTLNDNTPKVYVMNNNLDWAATVINETVGEMPVCFKAVTDGQYTISVKPEGVEVSYLHLIDNIAGTDIDLLATTSYTFNAKGDDYESRFRLVFSANSGNESGNANDNFAFISNGELIINGTGTLQVFDVLGRNVFSKEDLPLNSHLSTLTFKAGVYVLRLINGNDVKTQKMVIR